MAPGRRRGGKGAKTKSQLSLGDLVLAKVKGFPAWPAKISKPEDWEKTPDPKKYFVYFFGTQEIAFVAPADIQAFTNESKNKLSARCRGKTVKYFAQAVKEICEAFEESQGKSSSTVREDDDDGQDFDSEAHSGDVVLDGISADGSNGETNLKISSTHGSGLEHCSHRQEEMECEDMKPSVSSLANDNSSSDLFCELKNKLSNSCASLAKEEVSTTCPGGNCSNGELIGKEDSTGMDVKHQDGGKKTLINGHKSKKTLAESQRRSDSSFERQKNLSPGDLTTSEHGSSGAQFDLSVSAENHKDGMQRGNALGDCQNESPLDSKRSKTGVNVKKAKRLLKDKYIHSGVADNLQKDAEGCSKEQNLVDLFGKKVKHQPGQKPNLVMNETSHLVIRSKCADDVAKGSHQASRKSDVAIKAIDTELKRSTLRLKAENYLAPRKQTGNLDSNVPGVEEDLPPSKRRRRAIDSISVSTIISEEKIVRSTLSLKSDLPPDNLKLPAAQLPTKRRAVRLFDEDDDEEPKTPVHGGLSRKVDVHSRISECVKTTVVESENTVHDKPSARDLGKFEAESLKETSSSPGEFVSPKFKQDGERPKREMAEQVPYSPGKVKSKKLSSKEIKGVAISPTSEQDFEKPKKAIAGQVRPSPWKVESVKLSSREVKPILISPKRSPLLSDTSTPVVEPLKASKSSGKVSNIMQKKAQVGSIKGLGGSSDSLHQSLTQAPSERSKSVWPGERKQKTTPKSTSGMTDSILLAGKVIENNVWSGDSLEAGREDRSSSLNDSKSEDSAKSMKRLIAAAQAKRRQALSQSSHDVTYVQVSATDLSGGSPSSASAVNPILPGSLMQSDVHEYFPQPSYTSPSSHILQLSSNNLPDSQVSEEARISSGPCTTSGGALSGGTEAAVAREAFEGMIETLSRTKDSIARATRLAIDCAKYGIANEVVKILIQKLEGEPSFHKRVDLFFLVDSITQCSHSQKGIAGASYIPSVQAALSRLLGAAAPPGAAAHENRRQCLKVLRLWLERKILPEPLLRGHMDDIGASSDDDTSGGFFPKRPSRAERSIDDPIREMEGMLVDEYGSNATFQLPGFLSSHAFEEEEDDDILSISYKGVRGSVAEPSPSAVAPETCSVTPNDRRHCILEDVDGELEMEDVSGHLHSKDERPLILGELFNIDLRKQGSESILEAASTNFTDLPPLYEGSPPLPLDSPPPTPPLPSSPPPPPPVLPPPPLSPSPPPPPPPPPLPPIPSQPNHTFPPPSVPPQLSTSSQNLYSDQPSIASTSPNIPFPPLVPHEYIGPPSGHQLVPVAANNRHGGHVDGAVRSQMFPQQPSYMQARVGSSREPSGFNPSRSLDYAHDTYANPRGSHSSHQFQANVSLPQRVFNPTPPPQGPSGHFQYPNPTAQHHPQHPYAPPYAMTKHADAPRRYVADEQWRMPSNEFNADSQHGSWVNGVRPSLSSGPSFAAEGYFRPPVERPPNNIGFQPSGFNAVPTGASIPGHSGSMMIPCRPDLSSLNNWRPT